MDQSNLFGTDPKYRYKPLWSVGTAWNIHKEKFIEDLDMAWLKSSKLRAAYGFNGNIPKNVLPEVIAASSVNINDPGRSYMLALSSMANSGLRWEQTANYNIGLDFSIFRNIYGSIDYYTKKSTDILASNLIDVTKGSLSAIVNQASIRNNGLELELHADWITSKHFNWNTGLVAAYNNSKVLQVYNNQITPSSKSSAYISGSYSNYLQGYAVGAIFTYRYAGIDNAGYVLTYNKDGSTKRLFPTAITDIG